MLDICVLTAGARWDLLQRCLDAIQISIEVNGIRGVKVYVLDNGSSKESRISQGNAVLNHPVVNSTKRLHQNQGFPGGANAAIRMGKQELVLFVSDDIVLDPNALSHLVDTMKENEKVGLCGLKLLFPKDSTDQTRPAGKVQHVGHHTTLHGELTHIFIGWSADNPKVCESREVFSVTGATFITRRSLFEKVGGFDTVYGKGTWEDVDLALKMRAAGAKIYLDANAIAEHYVGATAEALKQPFPLNENRNIFMQRWAKSGLFGWDWSRW